MPTSREKIHSFLAEGPHAVVGASIHRHKYGNKVLRCYLQNDRAAYPVNPTAEQVEGIAAFPDLGSLPEPVHGVSIITPPAVTERVVAEGLELGIEHFWMQPGAQSERATAMIEQAGASVIAGDACLLVVLGYHESG